MASETTAQDTRMIPPDLSVAKNLSKVVDSLDATVTQFYFRGGGRRTANLREESRKHLDRVSSLRDGLLLFQSGVS